ncbi:MAG: hypothetical protein AAF442_09365 [Pseudomonadota bacterium]
MLTRLREALAPKPGGASGLIEKDGGWTPVGGLQSARDIPHFKLGQMQKVSEYLYRSNPLAKSLIDLPISFMLGEGLTPRIAGEEPDKKLVEWLGEFWNDPITNLPLNLPSMMREMALFGEQCWPVFVNEMNGQMRLGYVDPLKIQAVITDPDNAMTPIGVTVRTEDGNEKTYRIILPIDESSLTLAAQKKRKEFEAGECFFFKHGGITTASRGIPDLFPVAEWLITYNNALKSEVDRWDHLKDHLYDVTIKGGTAKQVKERAKEIAKIKAQGGYHVHNDSETWQCLTPNLQAKDASDMARMIRNHILAAFALPEHWLGGGGDVNRATAAEMTSPVMRIMHQRRREMFHMIKLICKTAVLSRENRNTHRADFDIVIEAPDMVREDITKYATSLAQVIAASATGIERGTLTIQTAVRIIRETADRLGVIVDEEEEINALKSQAAALADQDTYGGQSNAQA